MASDRQHMLPSLQRRADAEADGSRCYDCGGRPAAASRTRALDDFYQRPGDFRRLDRPRISASGRERQASAFSTAKESVWGQSLLTSNRSEVEVSRCCLFVTSATSKTPAALSSASVIRPSPQIFSKSLAWAGSNSTSSPRTLRTLSNSVVYSASQRSGWMLPSGEGGRRSPMMGGRGQPYGS